MFYALPEAEQVEVLAYDKWRQKQIDDIRRKMHKDEILSPEALAALLIAGL